MNRKQKILKMGIILLVLLVIIIGAVFFIQWKNGENKKVDSPNVEKPKEELDTVPTLDPSLSNEEKAIQIIINQTKLEKKDLEYLGITSEGLYRVKKKRKRLRMKKFII